MNQYLCLGKYSLIVRWLKWKIEFVNKRMLQSSNYQIPDLLFLVKKNKRQRNYYNTQKSFEDSRSMMVSS